MLKVAKAKWDELYAHVDLKGGLVAPTTVLKATSWKGPAIFPRGNHPRSPPFFPDGHSEYSAAICKNITHQIQT